jgi:hypothetical protein
LGEIFKSTKEQKEKARKRLENSERTRGNDEEYYDELVKTYKKFEDTRKRTEQI